MEITNNSIERLNQEIKELQRQKCIERRKLREEKKKMDRLRNNFVGEMVVKYFPEITSIIPGKKADNSEKFNGFEEFLKNISSNPTIMEYFRRCMDRTDAQCVSGQLQTGGDDNNGELPS